MSINATSPGDHTQVQFPFTIVLFGRRCTQTIVTLRRLLGEDFSVSAVVIPSQRNFGPALRQVATRALLPISQGASHGDSETLDQIAKNAGVALYEMRRPLSTDVCRLVESLSPDLIVASCFPWRVPYRLIRLAPSGAVNVHPSMLPEFRGPDPLFWALRSGAANWGVSVHRISQRFDAGPVLRQREFDITSEVIGRGLETVSSEVGAETLVEAIGDIRMGLEHAVQQDESRASYQGYPTEADLDICTDWSVQRALNFITGITQLGYEPAIITDRGRHIVHSAYAAADRHLTSATEWIAQDRVRIQLQDAAIVLQLFGTTG